MNLDEIQSLWSEDSKIDPDNLHTESTNIPALHAKYYRILNRIILLKKSRTPSLESRRSWPGLGAKPSCVSFDPGPGGLGEDSGQDLLGSSLGLLDSS